MRKLTYFRFSNRTSPAPLLVVVLGCNDRFPPLISFRGLAAIEEEALTFLSTPALTPVTAAPLTLPLGVTNVIIPSREGEPSKERDKIDWCSEVRPAADMMNPVDPIPTEVDDTEDDTDNERRLL